MLTLLSPAKKLNKENQTVDNCTSPIFIDDSEKLIKALRKYSSKKLSKLMSISPELSDLNVERYLKKFGHQFLQTTNILVQTI